MAAVRSPAAPGHHAAEADARRKFREQKFHHGLFSFLTIPVTPSGSPSQRLANHVCLLAAMPIHFYQVHGGTSRVELCWLRATAPDLSAASMCHVPGRGYTSTCRVSPSQSGSSLAGRSSAGYDHSTMARLSFRKFARYSRAASSFSFEHITAATTCVPGSHGLSCEHGDVS